MKSIVFEWRQNNVQEQSRSQKTRIVIGSIESADIRLEGPDIAPIHAVLEFDGEVAHLFDLGSATGVRVNGKKVVTRQVAAGDKIQIGSTELTFSLAAGKQDLRKERDEQMQIGATQHGLILENISQVEDLFDYKATAGWRALEVVTSWNGVILEVQHFVRKRKLVLGHSVVVAENGGFAVTCGDGVKGVLFRQSRLEDLQTNQKTPLLSGEYCKLREGELEFYLSYSDAPPLLRRRRWFERDPLFARLFYTSLALTIAVVLALLNLTIPSQIEAEQMPERIVKILYAPEQFKSKTTTITEVQKQTQSIAPTPPKTKVTINLTNKAVEKKPIPKEMAVGGETKKPPEKKAKAASTASKPKAVVRSQREAKEGEGAKAKGAEGKRGKPNALKDAVAQTKARPGFSQVQGAGNVDALKGAEATIRDLLTGSTAQFGKGGQKLQGTGGFDTEGADGLALSGTGRGGGGRADGLGLGTKGSGAGRIGTGLGAAGDGKGIVGGKSRVAVRGGGAEETVIMGSIDPDLVEAALMAHKDEFRLCYEREVNAGLPDLQGQMSTSFVIGSSGRVTSAGVTASSLKNSNVERCVLDVIRRIDFPIPRGAGLVQVNKSFRFRPTGGSR